MCFFIHGKLNTVGNLAGWIHEAMMHEVCVGTYLEEFAKQGTKMQELSFMKQSCALFSLVSCAFALPLDQGALCWSYVCGSLCVFFSFLQKVSGQQILERVIKDFFLFLDLLFTPMLKGNSNSTNSFSMDPKFLPTTYFVIIISRERFWKRDFFTVHKKIY